MRRTTGSALTFSGLLHRDAVLLVFLGGGRQGGGRHRHIRGAALFPQMLGHVVDVIYVFGRTIIFNMINANGPTFNLTEDTDSIQQLLSLLI